MERVLQFRQLPLFVFLLELLHVIFHSCGFHLVVCFDYGFFEFFVRLFLQLFAWKFVAFVAEVYAFLNATIANWAVGPPGPSASETAAVAGLLLGRQPSQAFQEFIKVAGVVDVGHNP